MCWSVQAAVTGCHGPRWLISNRNPFLTVLEAGKPKNQAPAVSMPGEDQHGPAANCQVLSRSSQGRRGGEISGVFYKSRHPIGEDLTLMT